MMLCNIGPILVIVLLNGGMVRTICQVLMIVLFSFYGLMMVGAFLIADFRPDYTKLGLLKHHFPSIPLLAVTVRHPALLILANQYFYNISYNYFFAIFAGNGIREGTGGLREDFTIGN